MQDNNQDFKSRTERLNEFYNTYSEFSDINTKSKSTYSNSMENKLKLESTKLKLEILEEKLRNNEINFNFPIKNTNSTINKPEDNTEIKKKRKKSNKKRISLIIIIFLFLGLNIFSIVNIAFWKLDSNKTDKQIKQVQEKIEVVDKIDSEVTEIIENDVPESDPYWDYIKMNLIDVDFKELKNINPSTSGWIQVLGTNINYPFVQHTDNDFYLNHTLDMSYNKAGWVFMDYRNNIQDFDKNTIIYAHGRMDNTMFGSLRRIITSGWLNNKENYVIKLSTESENTLWQVFSVYRIPTTGDYLKTKFNTTEDFLKFGEMLINRSAHDFNTSINENDKILTLSTCYDDYDKVVLHAKLIKIEKKQ